MAAVQRAFGDSLEQAEGRHHRTGGQHFNLQVAAGHVIDLLGVVCGVLVEDVLGGPSALPAHGDRAGLGLGDHGGGQGTGGNGHAFEQAATLGLSGGGHERLLFIKKAELRIMRTATEETQRVFTDSPL